MRVLKNAALALALAMSASAYAEELPPLPFPIQRGSAIAPPQGGHSAAPPEGAASGGVDFGRWRSADPAQYQRSFETQIRTRASGKNAEAVRADLEANGFRCEEGSGALDCRIEISERGCAFDWYVVRENAIPVVGFEKLCRGRG
jgi:hypothetical protein